MYRVTPVFEGDELVARGVTIEALSVEDDGEGICFNVYCYNVQPGVTIDYATGESALDGTATSTDDTVPPSATDGASEQATSSPTQEPAVTVEVTSGEIQDYVINENTGKFHYPGCSSIADIKSENRRDYTGTRDELIADGYQPCGRCKP
jgi:DNA-entry nuclease